jgi:hypothetical protein
VRQHLRHRRRRRQRSVEDTNRWGIAKAQQFLSAGKYGWFNNADATRASRLEPFACGALHANEQLTPPFCNVLTGADNSRWEYAGEPNTPDGYVVASQAKMIVGWRAFQRPGGSSSVRAARAPDSSLVCTTSPRRPVRAPVRSQDRAGRCRRRQCISTGHGDVAVDHMGRGHILTDALVASGDRPQVKPADRSPTPVRAPTGAGRFFRGREGKLDRRKATALATKPGSAREHRRGDGERSHRLAARHRSLEAGPLTVTCAPGHRCWEPSSTPVRFSSRGCATG